MKSDISDQQYQALYESSMSLGETILLILSLLKSRKNNNNNGRTPCNRLPARDKIPMARWRSVPFSTRLPLFRN